jgi:molybdopterin synthase catalytic subunit
MTFKVHIAGIFLFLMYNFIVVELIWNANAVGKRVTRLEYEAYVPLALKTLRSIVEQARELTRQGTFSGEIQQSACCPPSASGSSSSATATATTTTDLCHVTVVHRLGVVAPRESSIAIVVSSAHRREAFKACEWILEEVKKRAEVWKRECYDDDTQATWKENIPGQKQESS